ncbi:alpha-glucosidase [Sphingomonas mucosissima]|uniref:Alpha-glucosidase YihQ n=1 Tax=Sphingomonas mucosissima TaxID=370959 RepID=A0A245ZJI4_9SPHN|nr:alpha-glucosidase [Sphingomonas mucosissima]OWK29903.1 alpha-glucosidase YihQ [Sphingomonas mucosissima]
MSVRLQSADGGFDVFAGEVLIIRHRADAPALFVGAGTPRVDMYRGNYFLEDKVAERIALREATVDGQRVTLSTNGQPLLALTVQDGALAVEALNPALNRLWLTAVGQAGERFWGGGEQMSYVDMAGRRFPMWTSEPGVGRDKSTLMTFQCDRDHRSGGDYWNTNYPQPTYLSSRRYALHVDTTAYSCFDFRDAAAPEIEVWEIPARIELFAAHRFAGIVGQLSSRFGRQPQLPAWAYSGAILGLKDGTRSFERMEAILAAGAAVTGLWCEDWVGLRVTSFGKRLFWDWKANDARYPNLREKIAELGERGIRFMGYVNPYLAVDGTQYVEAEEAGYLALKLAADEPYIVDFGEFDCGIVDFTNPAAAEWFADRVIGREMLDLGLSGWMADFGEYLPTDVRLHDGSDGMLAHNAWPTLWAEVNARAVASRGKTGDAVFFMRAGFTGVGAHCPLLWAGDQCVDFSRHDGIGTVIRAALSSGLVGNAYHHSDLGGYTSLYDNVRTPELLMRWSELSAFSPVMRSHEGNRPDSNLQLDGDAAVLAHFVAMTKVHAALAPYVASLCEEAAATGLPVQRAMFLDYEDDAACWGVETQFAYGRDLIVAPVIEAGADRWSAYLPAGPEWRHLWSDAVFTGGQNVEVAAPIGQPPVFYRSDSAFTALFASIGTA